AYFLARSLVGQSHRGEAVTAQLGVECVPLLANIAGNLHGIRRQPIRVECQDTFARYFLAGNWFAGHGMASSRTESCRIDSVASPWTTSSAGSTSRSSAGGVAMI